MPVWQKFNPFSYFLNTNQSFTQMYVQNIFNKILVALKFPSGLPKTQSSDKHGEGGLGGGLSFIFEGLRLTWTQSPRNQGTV
jgi:hypothetical protein